MFRSSKVFGSRQWTCRLLVLLLALGAATTAWAQGERGVIAGTVADAQGGVLPGVSITVRNVDTGFTQTDVTSGEGQYRFGAVPLGRYELKAELAGFTTATVTNLTISINTQLQQNVTMSLSTLQESVTVTGQAPVIEVTKSEVSSVITQQQIEMLPVANRAAVTLALLLPGTSQDGSRPRRSNAQVGAGTLQFTTNSLADGTMNMSTKAGEPRQDFPQAAIAGIQGVHQPGARRIRRPRGRRHQRRDQERHEHLQRRRLRILAQQGDEPGRQVHAGGGRFGTGNESIQPQPVRRGAGRPDRDEQDSLLHRVRDTRRKTRAISSTPANRSSTARMKASSPDGQPNRELFVRVDGQINPSQSGFVRYAEQRAELLCEGCGGRSANAGNTLIPRDALVMGHTWVLGQRFLNEFRFNYAQQHQYQSPSGVDYYKEFNFDPARFVGTTATYNFPSFAWGNDNFFLHHAMIREWRDDFPCPPRRTASSSAPTSRTTRCTRTPRAIRAAPGTSSTTSSSITTNLAALEGTGQHIHGVVPGPDPRTSRTTTTSSMRRMNGSSAPG